MFLNCALLVDVGIIQELADILVLQVAFLVQVKQNKGHELIIKQTPLFLQDASQHETNFATQETMQTLRMHNNFQVE